jgi:hypothetical protein
MYLSRASLNGSFFKTRFWNFRGKEETALLPVAGYLSFSTLAKSLLNLLLMCVFSEV